MKLFKVSVFLTIPLLLTSLVVVGATPGGHPYPTNDADGANFSWEGKFKVEEEKSIKIEVFDESYIHENFVEGSRHPTVTFLVFHDGPSGWGKSIQDLPKDKFTGPGGHVEKTNLPLSKEDNKWVGEIVIVPQKSLKSIAIWKHQNKGGVHVGYNVNLEYGEVAEEEERSIGRGIQRAEAKPDKGFHFTYFWYVPKDLEKNFDGEKAYILVQPNNTGQPADDYDKHVNAARSLVQRRISWAKRLNVALLVPIFPRDQLYVHALDHHTLKTERDKLERVDLQLLEMIDDLRNKLSQEGIRAEEKILMNGFSASGMFTNRFTTLHPNQVAAVAIGSPGGWPTLPMEEYKGWPLLYPLGVSDLKEITGRRFNKSEFCRVPIYLYIGDEDDNQHKDDHYILTARTVLGEEAQEIWKNAKAAYEKAGCDATFKVYSGVGHDLTSQMREDVITFFEEHIS